MGALVLTIVLSNRSVGEYQPLFTNLQAADAAEIIKILEEQGIDYQLSDSPSNGTTVSVPADRVYRVRLELASQGLPQGGVVGFELLESIPLGATDFDRRMNYLRALQGELTRTIQHLDGVKEARVHISLPEESLFVQDRLPPTAAVLLRLESSRPPDAAQVRGIMNLVASSVDGLNPEDVTVIDQTGRVLSSMIENQQSNPSSGLAASHLDIQDEFQAELQQNVQSLLEQVFGPGNVVARVTADLNFDVQETERTLLLPVDDQTGQGFVRTVQELQEQFQGTGMPAQDPTGVNLGYPNGIAGSGDSNYTRTETSTEYDYNRVVERTSIAPGAVRRLSVAVVVNRQLTPVEEQQISNLVSGAIGLDPNRQDQISVVGMPFDRSLLDSLGQSIPPEPGIEEPVNERPQWVVAAVVAGALLAILAILLVLRRRRAVQQEEIDDVAALLEMEHSGMEAAPVQDEDFSQIVEEESFEPALEELFLERARKEPEQIARVIRTWLSER